ncbi:MAG: 5-(carboxyamino)imidazole ribonucleotide mutase [Treponema sp.]|nr:5-(carboxyamino)imidazole ribonucleotide mutase [Treponema sp.]
MKVAIFLGSKSDSDVMGKAAEVLKDFGVEYKAYIISAHRAGDLLVKTIAQVEGEGCEVIIAGAGLSAALPGVIASRTVLPVVGVPLECISPGKSNGLAGMDSLLSIVQMPPKVPVATVGIGNAKNAAYLALEILGIKYPDIRKKLVEFRAKMVSEAEAEGGKGFEF